MELEGLDRRKLERELASAVEDEERRLRVDEMKKRAIATARTYDEFRSLVACANQKPISTKEWAQFTTMYEKRHTGRMVQQASSETDVAPALAAAAGLSAPDAASIATFHDFDKYWRRSCNTAKERFECGQRGGSGHAGSCSRPPFPTYSFLIRFSPKRLARIFAQHPDAVLLSAMLEAYASSLLSKHKKKCTRAAQQLNLLLPGPLVVDFLTASDLPHVRALEHTLTTAAAMDEAARAAALGQLRAARGKIEAAEAKARAAESSAASASGRGDVDNWEDLSEDDL